MYIKHKFFTFHLRRHILLYIFAIEINEKYSLLRRIQCAYLPKDM